LSKLNTYDTAFFQAYIELENSEADLATNNEGKFGSSIYKSNFFTAKDSSEKAELKESPNKIPKYPNKHNEAILNFNKKASFEDWNINLNKSNQNHKQVLIYQASFNPEDKIKSNPNNSKEEKAILINNNYECNSESENFSPIGKLVSLQNIISNNAKNSNEQLDLEDSNLNMNSNNNYNINNKKFYGLVSQKSGKNDKNILELKNNFDTGTGGKNPNESISGYENIEEELNVYQQDSNENESNFYF